MMRADLFNSFILFYYTYAMYKYAWFKKKKFFSLMIMIMRLRKNFNA